VAELLLQRTIAKQVVPVFVQFLREFPTANILASAPLDKIRMVISPLGLVYRAGRLKSTAIMLVEKYRATVPESEGQLIDLPGVGKYAANAVLCFAFGREVPIVDHTIARVVRRVFSFDVGREPHKNKSLWDFMSSIIPSQRAREFNFAILDHADAVCLPRNPRCEVCPIREVCDYYSRLHA
jgi:A/G-specific adenine glycosylase